jgi:hypothetical protein
MAIQDWSGALLPWFDNLACLQGLPRAVADAKPIKMAEEF